MYTHVSRKGVPVDLLRGEAEGKGQAALLVPGEVILLITLIMNKYYYYYYYYYHYY